MTFATSARALLLLFCLLPLPLAAQEQAEGDHVKVTWLVPERFGPQPETIGLHFEVDPHWHVYWLNPGDSGAEPRFDFSGNATVGPPQWPAPTRLPVAHLTNLGYEGSVAYLFEVTPAQGAQQVELSVDLEWLVCEEECIPGFATMSLNRPLGESGQWRPETLQRRDAAAARVPKPGAGSGWTLGAAHVDEGSLSLDASGSGQAPPQLYPKDGAFVSPAEPRVERSGDGWRFRFATQAGMQAPDALGFVLVEGDESWDFDGIATLSGAVAAVPDGGAQGAVALGWLLALAFAGGVILNLMPCVFPVLAIKLFSLIGMPGGTGLQSRLREGLLYTAGVLATFAALGGVFLALRAGGAAVGWGFQLQSPVVVLLLVLLFWTMALAFLGVFELGHGLTRLAGKGGGGSFATGVLAVFVAAPCTGPFMGAALGASATLPAQQAMAIFLGLGAGLAAPFLLLAATPALVERLPKPGPWMDTLRQLLAFPLLATVLWLLWVLGRLGGEGRWLLGGIALLSLSFALWLLRSRRRGLRWTAVVLAVATLGFAVRDADRLSAPATAVATASAWQAYDRARIDAARAVGQAVFIDYTAAWCITCQVNKAVVLDTEETLRLFDDHDVLRVRADWTRYDPAITAALAELGRNSVPVYVFYPANGGAERVLPQILGRGDIRDLFPADSTGDSS
ncbi:protein-disulfide reductase DsbD family protein [Marilutibacter alkalisoli]|uniref:Glucan 1,4-alpha-glucosidase n=1 Tax=Marilutibacter alkalisoli TaxID=2591633 RepID=A0A514BSB9_9GAMM|nr:protein-disulfide reductase DsbD domain-containing protein [Lysobacter alkalisoli]QDH70292.1 glucan 1,4-alpha-glucosidase [Lysobacter alkalisoli]